jgi:hypothetical protein
MMVDLWGQIGHWWEDLFKPLDEKKRQQVLHPGSGTLQMDRPANDAKFQREYNRPAPQSAVKEPFTGWPAGNYAAQKAQAFGQVPDDMYAAKKAQMDPRLNPPMPEAPQEPSLMEQLLDRLDDPYGGFKGNVDTSALDQALKSRLSAIGGIRTNANNNFSISDTNLMNMHDAMKHDVETRGKQTFQDISNDQIAGLQGNQDQAVQALNAQKAKENAERVAMLKNLGIEASGATPSDQGAYDQGISSIVQRGANERANATGDLSTNLAYNQTVANSIGQQGAERRAALTQQLQGILGQLGMAESEANSDYANAKAQMLQQAKDRDYDMWNQNRSFDRQRYNDMFQQGMALDDQAFQREQWQAQQAANMAKNMPQPMGFTSLANDLVNTGFGQDETQHAMQILSQVLTSPEMQAVPQDANRAAYMASVLKRYGLNDVMAAQIATNYGNL